MGTKAIEQDERVISVEENDPENVQRGEPQYIIELADGYRFEDCITIHAWSIEDALDQLSRVYKEKVGSNS